MPKLLATEDIPSLLLSLEAGDIQELKRISTKNGDYLIVPQAKAEEHHNLVHAALNQIHDDYGLPSKELLND